MAVNTRGIGQDGSHGARWDLDVGFYVTPPWQVSEFCITHPEGGPVLRYSAISRPSSTGLFNKAIRSLNVDSEWKDNVLVVAHSASGDSIRDVSAVEVYTLTCALSQMDNPS